MSLIKFPTQIEPGRLTVQLKRVNEINASPLTNIQQVASRGNPAWAWTFEYVDLTDEERDIVHSFLVRCKGSLNTFKVPDFGDYGITGSVSDWIDIFSGYGTFGPQSLNSWFSPRYQSYDYHINDDKTLRVEHANITDNDRPLGWKGHGTNYLVSSLEAGASYVMRIRQFPIEPNRFGTRLRVDSANLTFNNLVTAEVYSADTISGVFRVETNPNSMFMAIGNKTTSTSHQIGDAIDFADYTLKRCGLIATDENLLTRSNEFDHVDWTAGSQVTVESGFADDPRGGNNYWRAYVNSDASAANHTIEQSITKTTTPGIFTGSIIARHANTQLEGLRLALEDSLGNQQWVEYQLDTGAIVRSGTVGFFDRGYGKIWDVGSEWYKCEVTARVYSDNSLTFKAYFVNSDGALSPVPTDTSYIEIHGAQLVEFPYGKHYTSTETNAIVGSGYVTGSRIKVAGFDSQDVIKAGQRIEIINRFHSYADNQYERSEFKRITRETRAGKDGVAVLEFDPPIRNAPVPLWVSDSAIGNYGELMHNPVIFHRPEMKARLIAGTVQYIDKSIKSTDIVFDVVEDLTE